MTEREEKTKGEGKEEEGEMRGEHNYSGSIIECLRLFVEARPLQHRQKDSTVGAWKCVCNLWIRVSSVIADRAL